MEEDLGNSENERVSISHTRSLPRGRRRSRVSVLPWTSQWEKKPYPIRYLRLHHCHQIIVHFVRALQQQPPHNTSFFRILSLLPLAPLPETESGFNHGSLVTNSRYPHATNQGRCPGSLQCSAQVLTECFKSLRHRVSWSQAHLLSPNRSQGLCPEVRRRLQDRRLCSCHFCSRCLGSLPNLHLFRFLLMLLREKNQKKDKRKKNDCQQKTFFLTMNPNVSFHLSLS